MKATTAAQAAPMDLQQALAVLAEPAKHAEPLWHDAADIVGAALEREAAELNALEVRASREALDLLSQGKLSEAQALSQELTAKRAHVGQLAQAAKEATRRMQSALDEAAAARDREQWKRAEVLAAERLRHVRELVAHGEQFAEHYKQVVALGDELWAALPKKPREHEVDFYAGDAIEYGVGRFLYAATGWQLGETWNRVAGGILSTPDLVGVCQASHAAMMSKAPQHSRVSVVVDAAEYERRKRAAEGG